MKISSLEKSKISLLNSHIRRTSIIVFLLISVTTIHYSMPISFTQYHDIFKRVYYIPIILGSFWYGFNGGVIVSVASAILYVPHKFFQWGGAGLGTFDQYLEIGMFLSVGLVTGFLADNEKFQKIKYQNTAKELEESCEKLREQARQILEKEQQLIRADRLATMGELAASLTHEVRNPLGAILGSAEILKDDYSPGDAKYEFLEIMIKEVNRLNRVISNFLSFARVQKPVIGDVDINKTIEDVKELIEIGAGKKGITVRAEFDPHVKTTQADKEQLKQAFLNIMLNSIQSLERGGEILIATSIGDGKYGSFGKEGSMICTGTICTPDYITISLRDNGTGIDPGDMDKIFTTFFTTRENGTGLGLPITKRIIESHSGVITVWSEVNKGTLFIIKLPLRSNAK